MACIFKGFLPNLRKVRIVIGNQNFRQTYPPSGHWVLPDVNKCFWADFVPGERSQDQRKTCVSADVCKLPDSCFEFGGTVWLGKEAELRVLAVRASVSG